MFNALKQRSKALIFVKGLAPQDVPQGNRWQIVKDGALLDTYYLQIIHDDDVLAYITMNAGGVIQMSQQSLHYILQYMPAEVQKQFGLDPESGKPVEEVNAERTA